jgi:hypothetical protein
MEPSAADNSLELQPSEQKHTVGDFFLLPFRVGRVNAELILQKRSFLRTLFFGAILAVFTVAAVFFNGAAVYHVFFEQYSTFLLEKYTGIALFGKMLSRYDRLAVFFTGTMFWLKFILFTAALFTIFFIIIHRIVHKKQFLPRPGEVFHIAIFSIASLSGITLIFGLTTALLRLVIPATSIWVFYLGFAGMFITAVPVMIHQLLCGSSARASAGETVFSLYISYFTALLAIVLLRTVNHYGVSLLRMV